MQCLPLSWHSWGSPNRCKKPFSSKELTSQATCRFHDFHVHTKMKVPSPWGRPLPRLGGPPVALALSLHLMVPCSSAKKIQSVLSPGKNFPFPKRVYADNSLRLGVSENCRTTVKTLLTLLLPTTNNEPTCKALLVPHWRSALGLRRRS